MDKGMLNCRLDDSQISPICISFAQNLRRKERERAVCGEKGSNHGGSHVADTVKSGESHGEEN